MRVSIARMRVFAKRTLEFWEYVLSSAIHGIQSLFTLTPKYQPTMHHETPFEKRLRKKQQRQGELDENQLKKDIEAERKRLGESEPKKDVNLRKKPSQKTRKKINFGFHGHFHDV